MPLAVFVHTNGFGTSFGLGVRQVYCLQRYL
jgi:hypothetical protein